MLIITLAFVVLSAESVTALYGGCVFVSLLVHYFALTSALWMGAEALLMFQKLVIVFAQTTTKYIVILSIVCWCKPLALIIIMQHAKPELSCTQFVCFFYYSCTSCSCHNHTNF
jgi:hypothetical protein